ncbi:MAG: protein kinase [Barnesiella sp.]|nr:protein kinase [Barnesiella sp.]
MALFLEEYEKLRMLGKGSFASVYKVRHHDLGYVRAIKVSNDLVSEENDRAYQTFLNECRVLLKIGNGCHPNIVRIYRPRLIANKAIVEMDYVDGVSLADYVARNRFIEYKEFKRFASEIVSAMAYCHVDLYKFLMDPDQDNLEPDPADGSRFIITPKKEAELIHKYGVNHNDLHSNNIMRRNYDGSFVLLDFGLAIQDDHCVKSSSRGDGAYEYCSPEKLEGQSNISSASDVYSLGILLYEMLAGRVPFVMNTKDMPLEKARYEVYTSHLKATPPPVIGFREEAFKALNPGKRYERDYPEAIDRIIRKCLMKNPDDRYPDAKALLMDLKEVFDAEENKKVQVEIPPMMPEITPKRPVPAPDNSADVKDQEIKELKTRLAQASANFEELRQAYIRSTQELNSLKEELASRPATSPEQHDETPSAGGATYAKASVNHSAKPFWLVGLLLMVIATIAVGALWAKTDYFRSYDSITDMVALGAGVAATIVVSVIGFLKKPSVILISVAVMLLALTGALDLMSTFGIWRYGIAAMSGMSLALVIFYWIRTESADARK